jgi:hypothetical protein
MRIGPLRRREFITLLGSVAAVCPLAAGAQQAGLPVVGWLSGRSPDVEGAISPVLVLTMYV